MAKPVVFTHHADFKLALLRKHGLQVTKGDVEVTVVKAERILPGYSGRQIAERSLSEKHMLRVVFEESSDKFRVITLYPTRKGRYESQI